MEEGIRMDNNIENINDRAFSRRDFLKVVGLPA